MTRPCFISLLLVFSLGLATVGFGIAGGQAPVAGQVEICTGHGIVTVTIDSEGNPVRTQTLCPDAALALLGATTVKPPTAVPLSQSLSWRTLPAASSAPTTERYLTHSARGPPV